MSIDQRGKLEAFHEEHIGLSKGALSLVVVLTRNAMSKNLPLKPQTFLTPRGGQVAGLGGPAIKKILKEHSINRILSNEGGRTSRGNIERMEAYVELINEFHLNGILDLDAAELYWIERVQEYFDALPFKFKLDPARSLRSCVRDLIDQAVERQREATGTMYAGTVMQHLVGAKLDIVTGRNIEHHGAAVADSPLNRSGDFLLGDVAVHVSTAPSEALLEKCRDNLSDGLRPLIITSDDGVGGAKALSKQLDIENRVDIIEIEQFITTNVYEWSSFQQAGRPSAVGDIIDRYNWIVNEYESDPSLRIEFDK